MNTIIKTIIAAATWLALATNVELTTVEAALAIAALAEVDIAWEGRVPRGLDGLEHERWDVVITVCDRAHEELGASDGWWHWSVPDPVEVGTDAAFDRALADLDSRIQTVDTVG